VLERWAQAVARCGSMARAVSTPRLLSLISSATTSTVRSGGRNPRSRLRSKSAKPRTASAVASSMTSSRSVGEQLTEAGLAQQLVEEADVPRPLDLLADGRRERVDEGAHEGRQVRVGPIGQDRQASLVERAHPPLEDRPHQAGPIAEVVLGRRVVAGTGRRADLAERHAVHAARRDQPLGGVEEVVTARRTGRVSHRAGTVRQMSYGRNPPARPSSSVGSRHVRGRRRPGRRLRRANPLRR